MKKVFLLAATAFMLTAPAFANNGGKKKKCAKGKTCCKAEAKKACCKKGDKTAKL